MNKYRTSILALCVSATCLVGIAGYESYKSEAYIPVKGDVPTIGYGETSGVKLGQRTTPERALAQLLVSTNKHAEGIKKCINVPLTQYEFDAYVSLAYNIGVGAFCRSTLVKKLNSGDYTGACTAIKSWNKKDGVVLRGLVARRQKEYRMCMGEAV